MKIFNKNIIFYLLLTSVLPVHSQNQKQTDFLISAKINAGCHIIMDDINLGSISGTLNVIDSKTAFSKNISISAICSKGAQYNLKSEVPTSWIRPSESDPTGANNAPLQYVHRMFRDEDPKDYEFVGYRMKITNPEYRVGTASYFGTGIPNDIGYNNSYISRIGDGTIQSNVLLFEYWALKLLRAGHYSANHNFMIEY